MKVRSALLACVRSKRTWFGLVVGALAAGASWWMLPPAPEFSIDARGGATHVFSDDLHRLALSRAAFATGKVFSGDTAVWDTHSGTRVCSFPYQVTIPPAKGYFSYAEAFTADGATFVRFDRGTAQFWDPVTGQIKQLGRPCVFPHNEDENEASSRLIIGADGRLFVLVKEKGRPWSVRDLLTDDEVGSFGVPPGANYNKITWCATAPLGVMFFVRKEAKSTQCRQVPTGKMLFELTNLAENSLPLVFWTITADGKTSVRVDGEIHVHDNERGERHFQMPADRWPVLSPDGRYLLVGANARPLPTWLAWLRELAGWDLESTVLYDLENGSEVATFRGSLPIQFSRDGRRLAIIHLGDLEIHTFPPRRQWAKIGGYTLAAAAGVWLFGWWFGRRRLRTKLQIAP